MCVSVTEGHSGDGCDLASTLCKYDLRKGLLPSIPALYVHETSLVEE